MPLLKGIQIMDCKIQFDYEDGFVCNIKDYIDNLDIFPIKRTYLSQLEHIYKDKNAYNELLKKGDAVVYEYIGFSVPESGSQISTGISIVHPGHVGNECFMTKGHVHAQLDFAEVYYIISGEGYMLMEKTDNKAVSKKISANDVLYVPGNCAHRTVNTGTSDLVMLFALRADAGHDYQIVANKGFSDSVFWTPDGTCLVNCNQA